ncbi:fimbria/pilus chaperone family protein [Yersinia ruckeri]|uniref:Beta-fimbriae chaperone protein n=1 Tax=Yersinia ruckeri TaxID=29486 RepID=A0A085U9E7_YERRU|nr:fimbria/pilus chaperone family protein [Yersinia ruckeri]ARZ02503.1 periplasmic chaperone protein [Yersinia ruckeri]KFE39810.1 Pili assembly chaperone [Yersinia ruckeri]KGA49875.1 hypothetical protein DJ39_181 [Yersinia ruckeri ATCC 29473]MCK8596288.1 fimbria/pilus periplasmic chaperone [Yersinia ruckeri]MCK8599879.1 fimbria/pilus periplasmic chaperone [Yersinia ruckeri]
MKQFHLMLTILSCSLFPVFTAANSVGSGASGIQLNESVIVIETEYAEGTATLTNKSASPVMLHSSLQVVAEDASEKVIVTPSVARVEPGETQLVRFFLKDEYKNTLKQQTLVRAIFQNIPPKKQNNVGLTIRHNVPLIIHPSTLPKNNKPWQFLNFSQDVHGNIVVKNDGDYVVRLSESLILQPRNGRAELPQSYILPGKTLVATKNTSFNGKASSVTIQPANLYGYISDSYTAELK